MTNTDLDLERISARVKKRDEEKRIAWENNELPPDPELRDKFMYDLRNGNIKVDFNGHLRQAEGPITLAESSIDYYQSQWCWLYDKLLYPMSAFFYGSIFGEEEDLELPTFIRTEVCGECGEQFDVWWTGEIFEFKPHNKLHKYVSDTPACSESGGIKDYSVEIDVPSGRLVFANDFRRFVPEADKDRAVNYAIEIKNTVLDYAESNVFHAFVGNTCPGVYVDTSGVITVGNPGYDEDNDTPVLNFGDERGSICTDLWWFSATDYQYLKERGADQDISDEMVENWIEVSLNVEPGRYRMTVHTKGNNGQSGERFATITRV